MDWLENLDVYENDPYRILNMYELLKKDIKSLFNWGERLLIPCSYAIIFGVLRNPTVKLHSTSSGEFSFKAQSNAAQKNRS